MCVSGPRRVYQRLIPPRTQTMKHLLLILVLIIAAYSAWQFFNARQRQQVAGGLRRHGLRLALVLLVLVILLVVAYYQPSIPLL